MSNNATKIDLYLKNSNGNPRTNSRVVVKPVRAGFWSDYVGLVEDTETIYQTDNNGYVQMSLWPLPYPYYLTYSDDDDAVPGQFLFYVPAVDAVVDFQDLIVTKADSSDKYADTILEQIVQAKVATIAAANAAKVSETNAAASAASTAADLVKTNADALSTDTDRKQVAITNQQLIDIYTSLLETTVMLQNLSTVGILKLGSYSLWVDAEGRLKIYNGTPSDKEADGTIVGTQS